MILACIQAIDHFLFRKNLAGDERTTEEKQQRPESKLRGLSVDL
jgi:hypothetical protein